MSWFPFLIYSFFPLFVHSFIHSFIHPFIPGSEWLCAKAKPYYKVKNVWPSHLADKQPTVPCRSYCLWAMKHLKSSYCLYMWHFPPSLIFSFITSEIKMLRPSLYRYHSCNQDVLPPESSENPISGKTADGKSESARRVTRLLLS